jgi:SAM-dependent methyltransferase
MADGRDVKCWDDHAAECEETGREPFSIEATHQNWLREKLVELEGVHKCLDVGCGPCYWIHLFEGKQYNAVDQSPGMLAVAKRQIVRNDLLGCLGELRQGNARQLGEIYEPGAFDLVFTSAVLQHNRHEPDKREIVEGLHHILREGGYYLCTENTFRVDNAPESVGNPDYTDGNSFTLEGWEKFMGNLGFELLDFSGKSEYLYRRKS